MQVHLPGVHASAKLQFKRIVTVTTARADSDFRSPRATKF